MVLIPHVRFVITVRAYSFRISSCLLAGDWYNYAASQGRQVVRDDRCGTNQTDFVTPEYATYPARLVCDILTACVVHHSSSACSRKSGRVAKAWTLSATDTIRTRENRRFKYSLFDSTYVTGFADHRMLTSKRQRSSPNSPSMHLYLEATKSLTRSL